MSERERETMGVCVHVCVCARVCTCKLDKPECEADSVGVSQCS